MHKVPTNFRYITAGRDTLFSKRSIAVSKSLNLLMKTAKTSFDYKIKGLDNCNFVIDSRNKVIEFVNQSNNNNERKQVSTWDFSTLYTKIPLDKLKQKVSVFVRKVFAGVSKSKKANFVTCSGKSKTAYFTKNRGKTSNSYSCEELIQEINCIVDNSYIVYHGNVYRQKVGIPMGTNCAPFLANIFLHVYEYEYLNKLVNEGNLGTAKLLSNTFRYQDDCIALNDGDAFRQHYRRMYPAEMTLENTNLTKAVCTFLDLRISIFRGKFRYCSYDKRKCFDFDICNYPHLDGNIPWGSSYGVFLSQLVRFCNINLKTDTFLHDIKLMVKKFVKQGFIAEKLLDTFLKFSMRYLFTLSKFGTEITTLISRIFMS